MLTIVGMPSSEMRWRNTSSRRASVSPSEPLRSAGSAAPKSTVTPFGLSGTPVYPTREPGAMPRDVGDGQQLRRRAVEACTRWPDPDGDRQRGVGHPLEQRLDLLAPDDRTAAVDLQDECLCSVGFRALDRLVDRVDHDRIEQAADLQHVDGSELRRSVVVLPGGCRIAQQRDHARSAQQADR